MPLEARNYDLTFWDGLRKFKRPVKYLLYLGAAGLIAYTAPRFYKIYREYPDLQRKVNKFESQMLEMKNSITDLSPIVIDLKEKLYTNSNKQPKQSKPNKPRSGAKEKNQAVNQPGKTNKK